MSIGVLVELDVEIHFYIADGISSTASEGSKVVWSVQCQLSGYSVPLYLSFSVLSINIQ